MARISDCFACRFATLLAVIGAGLLAGCGGDSPESVEAFSESTDKVNPVEALVSGSPRVVAKAHPAALFESAIVQRFLAAAEIDPEARFWNPLFETLELGKEAVPAVWIVLGEPVSGGAVPGAFGIEINGEVSEAGFSSWVAAMKFRGAGEPSRFEGPSGKGLQWPTGPEGLMRAAAYISTGTASALLFGDGELVRDAVERKRSVMAEPFASALKFEKDEGLASLRVVANATPSLRDRFIEAMASAKDSEASERAELTQLIEAARFGVVDISLTDAIGFDLAVQFETEEPARLFEERLSASLEESRTRANPKSEKPSRMAAFPELMTSLKVQRAGDRVNYGGTMPPAEVEQLENMLAMFAGALRQQMGEAAE